MVSVPYYFSSSLLQNIFYGFLIFIISLVACVFSPFGIGFVIFSLVRGFTKSQTARKVSLIFQIIFLCLTFLVGTLIGVYLAVSQGSYHDYNNYWILIISIFLGIFFACIIELIVIIWQGAHLRRKLGRV